MRKSVVFILVLCLISSIDLSAQKLTKSDKVLIQNLKQHIQYLASDELEGRRAGDVGEQKAVDYIISQYQNAGIQAMGVNGFIQNFPIDEGKKFSNSAFIKINNQEAILDTDFFALSNSGMGNFSSKASITLHEANQVWFMDVNDVLDVNTSNPHFDLNEWIVNTANQIKPKGAVALFLHNSGTFVDNIQFNKYDTAKSLTLPIVYFTKQGFSKLFNDELATYNIESNILFEHPKRTAHNVIGFIENKATNTIILGAHLDH